MHKDSDGQGQLGSDGPRHACTYLGVGQGGGAEESGAPSYRGLLSKGASSLQKASFLQRASPLQKALFLQRASSLKGPPLNRKASYLQTQRASAVLSTDESEGSFSDQIQTLAVIHRRPQEVRRTLAVRLVRGP